LFTLLFEVSFFVVLLGGLLGYEVSSFSFGDYLFSIYYYGVSLFSGSMWFMPFSSTYGVSFGPLGFGYGSMRVFDSGWIEYFGGQGLYCVLFNLGRINQWVQYSSRCFWSFLLCGLLFCC
jgi:NADH-ubiquinone oxidoreductase chain 5